MTHKELRESIKEVVATLDCVYYDKQCNFLYDEKFDDEKVVFYSRDYCKDISFKEVINWILQRVGSEEPGLFCPEDAEEVMKTKDSAINNFSELINLYCSCVIKGYAVQ